MITASRLHEVLRYEAETGEFTWLGQHSSRAPVGQIAGSLKTIRGRCYRHIGIDGKRYKAHRLAWLYVYGVMPPGEVDHKNNDGTDNRIDNLRIASRSQNARNRGAQSNNKIGLKGIHFCARAKKWIAKIHVEGRSTYLGSYDTAEKAHAAYQAAAQSHHGEFARAA